MTQGIKAHQIFPWILLSFISLSGCAKSRWIPWQKTEPKELSYLKYGKIPLPADRLVLTCHATSVLWDEPLETPLEAMISQWAHYRLVPNKKVNQTVTLHIDRLELNVTPDQEKTNTYTLVAKIRCLFSGHKLTPKRVYTVTVESQNQLSLKASRATKKEFYKTLSEALLYQLNQEMLLVLAQHATVVSSC